jgi:hypothetical protein
VNTETRLATQGYFDGFIIVMLATNTTRFTILRYPKLRFQYGLVVEQQR